jgi:hypothetical protein
MYARSTISATSCPPDSTIDLRLSITCLEVLSELEKMPKVLKCYACQGAVFDLAAHVEHRFKDRVQHMDKQ